MIRIIAGLSLCCAVAGCAQDQPVPIQSVTITASDYCKIASKLGWSVADTRPTIDGIRRHNAQHDVRCGKPSTPAS